MSNGDDDSADGGDVGRPIPADAFGPKTRLDFVKSAKRNLTEKELQHAISVQWLIAELDRRDDELTDLRTFRDRFHEVDKELAVLRERVKPQVKNELLSGVSLAAGSALLSLALPMQWQLGMPIGIVGAVLLLGSIFLRYRK